MAFRLPKKNEDPARETSQGSGLRAPKGTQLAGPVTQDTRSTAAMLDMTLGDLIRQNQSQMSFLERMAAIAIPAEEQKKTLRQTLKENGAIAQSIRPKLEARMKEMGLTPKHLDDALKGAPPPAEKPKAEAAPKAPPAAAPPVEAPKAPVAAPAKQYALPPATPPPATAPVAGAVPLPPKDQTRAGAPEVLVDPAALDPTPLAKQRTELLTPPTMTPDDAPEEAASPGVMPPAVAATYANMPDPNAPARTPAPTGGGNSTLWYRFFVTPRDQGGLGLSPHQAAGALANLHAESGKNINPLAHATKGENSFGAAQWNDPGGKPGRHTALKNFAAANKMDYRTTEAQQKFMRHEMDTSHNKAYQAILAAKTPREAATAWNRLYEISADHRGVREANADKLHALYGSGSLEGETKLAGTGGIGSDANAANREASDVAVAARERENTPLGGGTDIAVADTPTADKGFDFDKASGSVGDAFAGIGEMFAKSAQGSRALPSTPANATAPSLTPPSGPFPMVDPKMAEMQRQQLAMALQRLNSGKLV